MKGILKNVFAAFLTIACVMCLDIISVGYHATGVFAGDVDYGTYRNEYVNVETMPQLDIATRFNVEVEDIDCEGVFSRPSFGKAYHRSGSVLDYCRAMKPDILPDYQVRRTDNQNGSERPDWSMGALNVLCSLLLVVLLIIWGRSLFFRNSLNPDFKL